MARPIEWTEERLEVAKSVYLNLVAQGMSEHKIDAVDEMPVWSVRYSWQDDAEFLTQLQKARKASASTRMSDAQQKLEHAYERALDDAASPQLVTAANNLAKFQHMVASKLDRETWGDKSQMEHSTIDDEGKPTGLKFTVVSTK